MKPSYRKILSQLWSLAPSTHWPCTICGSQTTASLSICTECRLNLPWNKNACIQCAIPMSISGLHCGRCQKRPPPTDVSLVPFLFQNSIKQLLTQYKFSQRLDYGNTLAELFSQQVIAENIVPDAIIPIPLHPTRLKERGFDQSLELAKIIGKHINRPVLTHALKRIKYSQPLANMSAKHRRQAIRNGFVARDDIQLPQHVALLDDVMTTGSTLFEAARTLRNTFDHDTKRLELTSMPNNSQNLSIQTWAVARTPIPT